MKKRRFWGVALISTLMLIVHFIAVVVDMEKTITSTSMNIFPMFVWSLVLYFSLRGEIAEVRHTSAPMIFVHIVTIGTILFFGGGTAVVTTVFGSIQLIVLFLAISMLIWTAVFVRASYLVARSRPSAIDLDLQPEFEERKQFALGDLVQKVAPLGQLAVSGIASARQQWKARAALRKASVADDRSLSEHDKPTDLEKGLDTVFGAVAEAGTRAAPAKPASSALDEVLAARGAYLREFEADLEMKIPPRRKIQETETAPTPVLEDPVVRREANLPPEPAQVPADHDTAETEDFKIDVLSDEALQRRIKQRLGAYKKDTAARHDSLATALSAKTTIEAVTTINDTAGYKATLGIRDKGRFVTCTGRARLFKGLQELKDLIRAELEQEKSA